MTLKQVLRKTWHFLWHEDSLLSWIVNVLLAFVIVKFLIYPGLGLLLGTDYPVVAVVSSSMDHQGLSFEEWWNNGNYDEQFQLESEDIRKFKNGFNKGDLMVLFGLKNIREGDVIVFWGSASEPIIHRVVDVHENGFYQTKGDNLQTNPRSRADEMNIPPERLVGKAVLRVPYLGWFKVGLSLLIQSMRS